MNVPEFYQRRFVTSEYGEDRDGGSRKHMGVDFSHSSATGTVEVPAARPGQVVGKRRPGEGHGYGYGIIIRSLLDDGNWWDISYNHGHYFPDQPIGSWVQAGDVILHEGLTGWTTGPCVHIEQQRVGGGFTDPEEEMLRVGRRWAHTLVPIADSNRRQSPSSQSPITGNPLVRGSGGTFVGIVQGENVEGNPWWLQGMSGNYFWTGAFKPADIQAFRNA